MSDAPILDKDDSLHADKSPGTLGFFHDVELMISVELGRTDLTIERLLQLTRGSVIEVEKLSEEPLDIYINGHGTARGEAVIVNEKFGVRVTQISAPRGEEML
jgi:flagellar motor switch protein FliN/FliY